MSTKKWYYIGTVDFLLTLLIIFNIFDIVMTYHVMRYGVEEANPLTQSLIVLLVMKTIFTGMLITLRKGMTERTRKLLWIPVIAYGMIAVWHIHGLSLIQ